MKIILFFAKYLSAGVVTHTCLSRVTTHLLNYKLIWQPNFDEDEFFFADCVKGHFSDNFFTNRNKRFFFFWTIKRISNVSIEFEIKRMEFK